MTMALEMALEEENENDGDSDGSGTFLFWKFLDNFLDDYLDTEHDDGLEFHTGDRMEEEHLYECESDEDMSSDGPDGFSSS